MPHDGINAAIHHHVTTLRLVAHDGRRKGVGFERPHRQGPAGGEQSQAEPAKGDRGWRPDMPAQSIEAADHDQASVGAHESEQQHLVPDGLALLQWQFGPFTEKAMPGADDAHGANDVNQKENSDQHPGSKPAPGAGRLHETDGEQQRRGKGTEKRTNHVLGSGGR